MLGLAVIVRHPGQPVEEHLVGVASELVGEVLLGADGAVGDDDGE